MMRDFEAAGLDGGGGILDKSEMKTVVLPEPVGRDTPIRETPDIRASTQAFKQVSWYGLRVKDVGSTVEAFLEVDIFTWCNVCLTRDHGGCLKMIITKKSTLKYRV